MYTSCPEVERSIMHTPDRLTVPVAESLRIDASAGWSQVHAQAPSAPGQSTSTIVEVTSGPSRRYASHSSKAEVWALSNRK